MDLRAIIIETTERRDWNYRKLAEEAGFDHTSKWKDNSEVGFFRLTLTTKRMRDGCTTRKCRSFQDVSELPGTPQFIHEEMPDLPKSLRKKVTKAVSGLMALMAGL